MSLTSLSHHDVFTKKGLQPLSRFRAVVHKVIANLPWLQHDDYVLAPLNKFDSICMKNLISAHVLSHISVFQKLIFFKPPEERTVLELQTIEWMFAIGFKFFHLCPIEIKMALIRRATYKCYGPGRWILKQGHLSTNMYLIVKGHVLITEDVQNSVTKLMDNTECCKLKEKQSFGESAVMFNTFRTNSVQSLSTVELISISKNDFMDIIKDNLQLQWNANAIAIKNSSYFKHLSLMELNKCSTISFIKTFKEHEYVLGKGTGDVDFAHFVLEGEISLIMRLKIERIVNRFGNMFNYFLLQGENIMDNEFMTTNINETKCLCVPHWFMAETEKLKCWEFVKLDLNHIILSKDQSNLNKPTQSISHKIKLLISKVATTQNFRSNTLALKRAKRTVEKEDIINKQILQFSNGEISRLLSLIQAVSKKNLPQQL
ncbi:hypothetical protein QTP88_005537 [Uroleucon formosanum]